MRYNSHLLAMPRILDQNGIERLKFIDEVHFVTIKLYRRKCVGPCGKIIAVSNNCDLKESFSMTLMTRMDNRIPFSVSMRVESNWQYDFAFLLAAVLPMDLSWPAMF